jgi:hypothetical protein
MIPQRKMRNKAITNLENKKPVIEFSLFDQDYMIEVKPEHYRQMLREGKINP